MDNDYRIKNDDELYKALYHLRKLREEQAEDDKQREKELSETDSWYKPAKEARAKAIEFEESRIQDYSLAQREQDSHWRYRSRNGTVSFSHRTNWSHDDAKLLSVVPDDYIDTNPKVRWGDYKKTLTPTDDGRAVNEDGEVVDGVVTARELKINIKPTEDKK